MRAYTVATLAWAIVFFARFIVQQWLYNQDDAVGALGVTRILMGLPLTAVVVLVTVWAVRPAGRSERGEDTTAGSTRRPPAPQSDSTDEESL